MELWRPPTDQPHLLEWWRPALLASRAARQARCPWPIHLDELMLMGRVDRPSRSAIWVYKHVESRGELYLDGTGQAYKFTKTPNARSLGRFTSCDLRAAIWRAGLPAFVEPIVCDAPRHDLRHAVADEAVEGHRTHPSARSRGHLTLVVGGRPLAG